MLIKSWDALPENYSGYAELSGSGSKFYLLNGEFHNENGPAIEYSAGSKFWYDKGKKHRLDGPAVVWSSGDEEYWIFDERIKNKKAFEVLSNILKLKELI